MAEIHLVTGHKGEPHVTAKEMGLFNEFAVGNGQYVFDFSNKLACVVESANSVKIQSGDILLQGRHISIPHGQTVSLTLRNGEQGKKRYDAIICRYTLDTLTGLEKAELLVIESESSPSWPEQPTAQIGNIEQDATQTEMLLYVIPIDEITVGTPIQKFQIIDTALNRESALLEIANEAQQTANAALPKAGGTLTGNLTLNEKLILKSGCYGTTLPEAGTPGRIFFKKV